MYDTVKHHKAEDLPRMLILFESTGWNFNPTWNAQPVTHLALATSSPIPRNGDHVRTPSSDWEVGCRCLYHMMFLIRTATPPCDARSYFPSICQHEDTDSRRILKRALMLATQQSYVATDMVGFFLSAHASFPSLGGREISRGLRERRPPLRATHICHHTAMNLRIRI
jgi:hypothetical protein